MGLRIRLIPRACFEVGVAGDKRWEAAEWTSGGAEPTTLPQTGMDRDGRNVSHVEIYPESILYICEMANDQYRKWMPTKEMSNSGNSTDINCLNGSTREAI